MGVQQEVKINRYTGRKQETLEDECVDHLILQRVTAITKPTKGKGIELRYTNSPEQRTVHLKVIEQNVARICVRTGGTIPQAHGIGISSIPPNPHIYSQFQSCVPGVTGRMAVSEKDQRLLLVPKFHSDYVDDSFAHLQHITF